MDGTLRLISFNEINLRKNLIPNLLSFAQEHCKSKIWPCSCLWHAQKRIFLKFYKDLLSWCKMIKVITFPLCCNGQNWFFHPFLKKSLLYAITIIISWYYCHSYAVLALKNSSKGKMWRKVNADIWDLFP